MRFAPVPVRDNKCRFRIAAIDRFLIIRHLFLQEAVFHRFPIFKKREHNPFHRCNFIVPGIHDAEDVHLLIPVRLAIFIR